MQIFQFIFSVWVLLIFYLRTEFTKGFTVQKTILIDGSYSFVPKCRGRRLNKLHQGENYLDFL